jgi:hypothetical protein
MYRIQSKIFRLDPETVNKTTHRYLATYKLPKTAFAFVPWIALVIIE